MQGGREYNISVFMVARARGGGFDSTGSAAEMIPIRHWENLSKISIAKDWNRFQSGNVGDVSSLEVFRTG